MPGIIGIVAELERRRGSNVASDRNDAYSLWNARSQDAATPPASIHIRSDNIPEIGGSEGGFIGLIVGLAIIFLASCIGVFFLLRNWQHGGRTIRGKSGEVGKETSAAGPGFPRRRGTLFGFRSNNPKRAGWERAPGGEEDEWDADDTLGGGPYDPGRESYASDPVKLGQSTYGARSAARGEVTVPNLEYTPRAIPHQRNDDSSVSTVDLDAPGRLSRDEPFVPPVRSVSPATITDDSLAHYPTYIDQLNRKDSQGRHTSLDSTETAVTFPGGTKFKEDL